MPDHLQEQPTTPEALGQTYAAMLGDEAWQNDAAPERPTASAEEHTTPPAPLRIIEALLFVGGSPLTAKRAREILRGLSEEQFSETIVQLNADYRRQARPYSIQPQGAGWVVTLRPRYRHVIEKLYGGVREARLSTAAIDVLALVAYRQPVPKPDVDTVRGADSGALLRQLVRRGLIQIVPIPGAKPKEIAYATTPRFLEMFGLQSLDDLPKTHDLQQL
jgi:segregation and condensation protein B